jgi:tetratricopeptide (TPR) repeat protein
MLADSAARARNDVEASNRARQRAIELSNRLVSEYPNYQYRLTYQRLAARLLAETGKNEDAVSALRTLTSQNRNFEGRADAMVQLATTLDTLGKKKDAAQAYEEFASAYPSDKRAADAQYNAAATYIEAGDTVSAARAYSTFAARFPRDTRAAQARQLRIGLLQASGDSASARSELTRLCSGNPTGDLRAPCAAQTGDRYFRQGASLYTEYQQEKLVISSIKQLTKAGVERASARKIRLRDQMVAEFKKAIASGDPRSIAGATYYLGLAQYEYGDFLKNVQLPSGLTPEQVASAQQGSATQAEQYYTSAKQIWQALIDKAEQDATLKNSAEAAPWLERTRNALQGNVDANPPTAALDATFAVGE